MVILTIMTIVMTTVEANTRSRYDDDENIDDGIRYQDREEIRQIDRWIKNYLEIENIPHIDLSGIDIKKRQDHVVKLITN